MQLGEDFPIFQDRNDIQWGQNWEERIEKSLDAVTFLIPILTPSFFKSPYCRKEVEQFLKRESDLKRNDLILPVYYVNCSSLNDEEKRAQDEIIRAIVARQNVDWRELRLEPHTSPSVARMLERMGQQIVKAFERTAGIPLPAAPKAALSHVTRKESRPTAQFDSIQEQEEALPLADKSDPPTWIIDPLCRGQYSSISDAIARVVPGSRLLVRPGLYEESLVIDKPLEIIGDGAIGEIVVQSSKQSAIIFKTTFGRVSNLTIRQLGGGRQHCIDIAQGRLDLEGCDISSQSRVAVAVHGGADPRIRRNRIHDSKLGGILVYDGACGTFEDNDIFANLESGVKIKSSAAPVLRRNRIHDNDGVGVVVCLGGRGLFEENEIFANSTDGASVLSGSDPTFRRNHIRNNKEHGVGITDNGRGFFEENEISFNGFDGVYLFSSGSSKLLRNQIHDNEVMGVSFYEEASGTLEGNEIFDNRGCGVEISDKSNPVLVKNNIRMNGGDGIFVLASGQGCIEDNNIFSNGDVGIRITDGGNPQVIGNHIQENSTCGILFTKNGGGLIADNDIRSNGTAGVDIDNNCCPTLRRNTIGRHEQKGIFVRAGGGGIFEDNDLRGNRAGAWGLADGSNPQLKRTRNLE